MRKILALFVSLVISLTASAQISFLGIALNGSPVHMAAMLQQIGFEYKSDWNGEMVMAGDINGERVETRISYYNGKVYRVVVDYLNSSGEESVTQAYNSMVHKFEEDEDYYSRFDEEVFFTEPVVDTGLAEAYDMLLAFPKEVRSMSVEERKKAVSLISTLPGFELINEICFGVVAVDRPGDDAVNYLKEDFDALIMNKVNGRAEVSIMEFSDGYHLMVSYVNPLGAPQGEGL